MKARTLITAVAATTFTGLASAGYGTLDLDRYAHGQVLSGQDLGDVVVDAKNFHSKQNILAIFDTGQRRTRDRDLEGPNGSNGGWAIGNLAASNTDIGNILIIQEVDKNFAGYTDASKTILTRPDDEGRRSGGSQPGAGKILFSFDHGISAFGFTLVDVEQTGEFNKKTGFFATFESASGQKKKVSFADFIDPSSDFYDPSIKFGDNSANRIADISATDLGLSSIDKVTVNLGGSGGVGSVRYTAVPTPGAAGAGLVLMGLLGMRRRRRDKAQTG